jgi:hypothetical protein
MTLGVLVCGAVSTAIADDSAIPKYKPSSSSPLAIDIRSATYGASRLAPDALSIGDPAPNFEVARAGGGQLKFPNKTEAGPTVLIFYRGHW